jgi:hypothetical protein
MVQNDWQVMNDAAAKAARPGVYRLQLVEMHVAHHQLRSAIRDLSGDIDPNLIDVDVWLHYEDHTAQVRAWRERHGI